MSTTFRQRLNPEAEMADLEQRAKNAQRYALDAIAEGDAGKLEQAVERLLLRFDQYDALMPAGWPASTRQPIYQARHGLVWAILEALGEDGHDGLFQRLLEVAYQYAAESTGVPRETATTEAALSMRRWPANTSAWRRTSPTRPAAGATGARR